MKFLTYDASTALNMFLANAPLRNSHGSLGEPCPLFRAIKEGLTIPEAAIVFAVSPSNLPSAAHIDYPIADSMTPLSALSPSARGPSIPSPTWCNLIGDVLKIFPNPLDKALWKIGGASVTLRLLQLARVGSFLLLFPWFLRILEVTARTLTYSWNGNGWIAQQLAKFRGHGASEFGSIFQ